MGGKGINILNSFFHVIEISSIIFPLLKDLLTEYDNRAPPKSGKKWVRKWEIYVMNKSPQDFPPIHHMRGVFSTWKTCHPAGTKWKRDTEGIK